MKRIIEISEEEYELLENWGTRPYLVNLIKNSTPLNEVESEDCISREQALLCLTGVDLPGDVNKLIALFNERFQKLPGVTPKSDRPSGEWIWDVDITPSSPVGSEEVNYAGWICSNCHEFPDDYIDFDNPEDPPTYKYCPNCGCKMDGGKVDDRN